MDKSSKGFVVLLMSLIQGVRIGLHVKHILVKKKKANVVRPQYISF